MRLVSVADGFIYPVRHPFPGFLILPARGTLYSPCAGLLTAVDPARGRFSIAADAGLRVTVDLFSHLPRPAAIPREALLLLTHVGAPLGAGQVLARTDLGLVRGMGLDVRILVSLTATPKGPIRCRRGRADGGRSPVLFLGTHIPKKFFL